MEQREHARRQRERRRRRRRLLYRRLLFALGAGAVLLGISLIVLPASGLFRQPPEAAQNRSEAAACAPSERVSNFMLDAPFLDQREFYPTGCESVSAVMALRYFGVEIDTEEFIDDYLPLGDAPYEDGSGELVGCDPREAFPGDPRTEEGWGCYAPVIENALNDLIGDRLDASRLTVESPENKSLSELCSEYVAKGMPVILWATIEMEPPEEYLSFFIEETGEEFHWIYPLHCLLLTGWTEDGYLFNDPSAGKGQFYPKDAAELAYDGLGRQALVLVPVD